MEGKALLTPIVSTISRCFFFIGSCIEAGYNSSCCEHGYCAGYPFTCFCDSYCHDLGDCCSDIDDTCPQSKLKIIEGV